LERVKKTWTEIEREREQRDRERGREREREREKWLFPSNILWQKKSKEPKSRVLKSRVL
jgi:hypothetical protein